MTQSQSDLLREIAELVYSLRYERPNTVKSDHAADLLLRCKSALEASERDAQRYRWAKINWYRLNMLRYESIDKLDSAIDAALASQQKEKQG